MKTKHFYFPVILLISCITFSSSSCNNDQNQTNNEIISEEVSNLISGEYKVDDYHETNDPDDHGVSIYYNILIEQESQNTFLITYEGSEKKEIITLVNSSRIEGKSEVYLHSEEGYSYEFYKEDNKTQFLLQFTIKGEYDNFSSYHLVRGEKLN